MMVSLTISIDDNKLKSIENFGWVSWSELAREELRKKIIFEKYLKNKNITSEDLKFCEDIDWHPVDELPFKKSFINAIKKESHYKKVSIKDLDKLIGLKNV
jgi:hypothetical protein